MVQPVLAVYFVPGSHGLPDLDAAARDLDDWASAHVPSPLREAVAAFRKAGLLTVSARPADQPPPLPIEPLQFMVLVELEDKNARSPTDVALALANDLSISPRAVLWAALSVAFLVRS